ACDHRQGQRRTAFWSPWLLVPLGNGPDGGAGLPIAYDRKVEPHLRGVMFHAQQPQSAAASQRVGRVETAPIIPHFQNSTSTCGLYRDFNRGATGVLYRV